METFSLTTLLFIILLLYIRLKIKEVLHKQEYANDKLDKLEQKIVQLEKSGLATQEIKTEAEKAPDVVVEETITAPLMAEEQPTETLHEEVVEEAPSEPIKEVPQEEIIQETSKEIVEEAKNNEEIISPAKEPTKEKKRFNLEEYVGENLFSKVGILIFVLGIGYFVKYSIDQNWINETFRAILGFIVGFALLGTAKYLSKEYRVYSSLLAGGAFAVFFMTDAIAYHYYELYNSSVAFAILVITTIIMVAIALIYDRRELAITALIGGFMAPFLVSSGSNNFVALFVYMLILCISMSIIAHKKKWGELISLSFYLTTIITMIFTTDKYVATIKNAKIMFVFATLFYFVFIAPIITILKTKPTRKANILLASTIAINNFAYLLFGKTYLNDCGFNLPIAEGALMCIIIAAINVALYVYVSRAKGDTLLRTILLAMVVTFITIAIPMQFKVNVMTLLWAVEMTILLILSHKTQLTLYKIGSLLMGVFTIMSFICTCNSYASYEEHLFLNKDFLTVIGSGFSALIAAVYMDKHKEYFLEDKILNYVPVNAILYVFFTLTTFVGFSSEAQTFEDSLIMTNAIVLIIASLTSLYAVGFQKRFYMPKYKYLHLANMALSTGAFTYSILTIGKEYEWVMESNGYGLEVMRWITLILCVVTIIFPTINYFKSKDQDAKYFLLGVTIISTVLWIIFVRYALLMLTIHEYSASFSVALGIAGFVQMYLGMIHHKKSLRMISLVSFGIVLAKLILSDLWVMSSIGKIITFISLGLFLLVLSFLYQKKKDTFFKDDE